MKAMKLTLALALLLATVTATTPAMAELIVNGQVRVRPEVDGRDVDPAAGTKQFTDLRMRLGIGTVIDERTKVFVQMQDSRRFGGALAGGASSGTLNNGANVDVHQAYILVNKLFSGYWGFQAGRFEVNLGNQRVFGAVGWHNVGRSWEGMNLRFANEQVKATAYWLKKLELNDPVQNQDFDIYGVNVKVPDAGLEVFGFYELDDNILYADTILTDVNQLDRFDFGAYFKRAFGDLDVEANAVYQSGTMGVRGDSTVSEMDIAAYLFTAELGYTLPTDRPARVAAGVDIASGDDDPADNELNAYNNLYYTGHKFRGYMDYFLGSNPQGLVDIMGRGSMSPADGWKAKVDVHYFTTAKDYTDFEGNETSDVGVEVDLGVSTARVPGVSVAAGLGLFMPSDSFASSTDSDTGLWGYLMFTSNFKEIVK